jgi:hypothetical protein
MEVAKQLIEHGMSARNAKHLIKFLATQPPDKRADIARGFAKEIKGDTVISHPEWVRGINFKELKCQ